jgi:hypothetical protein
VLLVVFAKVCKGNEFEGRNQVFCFAEHMDLTLFMKIVLLFLYVSVIFSPFNFLQSFTGFNPDYALTRPIPEI